MIVGALLLIGTGAVPGRAAAYDFTGTWTVHPTPGTPWASGSSLVIASSDANSVRAIGSGGDFQHRCSAGVTAWYTVKYAWPPGGTLGGCVGSQTAGNLFAFDTSGATFMNLNTTSSAAALAGFWTNTGVFNVTNAITATLGGPVPATSTGGAVQNEVRVVSETDCQFHKGGSAPGAWIPIEKDTVLKQGDEVSCDPDSEITVAFADNSTFTFGNTTQFKIASLFTDGGVVKAEILIRMGQVAAQVHHEEATKSDYRIKSPTATASVRGTVFKFFYDPGSHTSGTSVTNGVVSFDPVKAGLPTVSVSAGKAVVVDSKGLSPVGKVGQVGARGGLELMAARDLVMKVVAANMDKCALVTPREDAFSVTAAPNGWTVSIKASAGKVMGTATWSVIGGRVAPTNTTAKAIAAGCTQAIPDVTGAWTDGSLHFQLKTSGNGLSNLHAAWTGGPGHEKLQGVVDAVLAGTSYTGPMTIDEGSVHVTGTMTFTVASATQILVTYTQSNGVHGTMTLRRS